MRNKTVGHETDEILDRVALDAVLHRAVEDFMASDRGQDLLAGFAAKCVAKLLAPLAATKLLCAVLKAASEPEPPRRRRQGSGITAPW
jgi:hypothetical protein